MTFPSEPVQEPVAGPRKQTADLLRRWLAAHDAGHDLSPHALGGDHPEVLSGLERSIAILRQLQALTADGAPPTLTPPPDTRGPTSQVGAQANVCHTLPEMVGGYRVVGLLGEGGMGRVFRAEDPRLDRPVALKLLRPSLADQPQARIRFLREARMVATLQHENIVTIYQVGEDQGVPFIVMPLLAGESLDTRLLREGQLPIAEVIRIGREAAQGLAAAHAAGLVHRDIKPANLWLEATSGRVKVLDFGLARPVAGSENLTQAGAVLGTPAYMSPEQITGDTVDARSDLFSLGCVLFHAATGRLPFSGKTIAAVWLAVLTEQVPPLSQVRPEIPSDLADLVCRLLAKQPENRVESAAETARLLDAMGTAWGQGGTQVETVIQPAPLPWRRSRSRGWWFLGAVIAMVLVAIGVAIWLRWPEQEHTPTDKNESIVHLPNQPTVSIPDRPLAAAPLDARVTVKLFNGKGRLWRQLDENGALPARMGELVRIDLTLSRPGHVYVVWLSNQGDLTPLHPWNGDRLKSLDVNALPEYDTKQQDVACPPTPTLGWKMDDSAGLESILVLARTEPLTKGERLSTIIGDVPQGKHAPLRNLAEAAMLRFDRSDTQAQVQLSLNRGPKEEAQEVDAPVLRIMDRLRRSFEVVRVVRFAHAGR